MNTKHGVVAELKLFADADGNRREMRATLMGEDPVWWYPVSGPLPDVGDSVKVVLLKGDEPYIDTAIRA